MTASRTALRASLCVLFSLSLAAACQAQMRGGKGGGAGGGAQQAGRAEIEAMVETEKNNPTTADTVRERYAELEKALKGMVRKGHPVKDILSSDGATEITTLLGEGKLEAAVTLVHAAILRMAPHRPGETGKTPSPPGASPSAATGTARLFIDAASDDGLYQDFLFGTISGPIYAPESFALAADAGFKCMQVRVCVDNLKDEMLDGFEKSVRHTITIGAQPVVWLMLAEKRKQDDAVLAKNVGKVLAAVKRAAPGKNCVFRIGNEPDNEAFWAGSQEEYFQTYAVLAKAVKAQNPKHIVGGVGFMKGVEFAESGQGVSASCVPWVTAFLAYATGHEVPVDYLSTHAHSAIAYHAFRRQFMELQTLVARYPQLSPLYGAPKLGNDEWNLMVGDMWSGSYHVQLDTIWAGVCNTLSWIALADSKVWLSIRYGGTANGVERRGKDDASRGHDFPLTTATGEKKPSYHAFTAINSLAGLTKLKVDGNDYVNLACAAGRDKTGQSLTVIVANSDVDAYYREYPAPKKAAQLEEEYRRVMKDVGRSQAEAYGPYEISLKNMPERADGTWRVEKRILTSDKILNVVESVDVPAGPTIILKGNLPMPGLLVVTLKSL